MADELPRVGDAVEIRGTVVEPGLSGDRYETWVLAPVVNCQGNAVGVITPDGELMMVPAGGWRQPLKPSDWAAQEARRLLTMLHTKRLGEFIARALDDARAAGRREVIDYVKAQEGRSNG